MWEKSLSDDIVVRGLSKMRFVVVGGNGIDRMSHSEPTTTFKLSGSGYFVNELK